MSSKERVVALYGFSARDDDELSFKRRDVITVLAKYEDPWWEGELNGKIGLFPANYVAPQDEDNCIKEDSFTKEDNSTKEDSFTKEDNSTKEDSFTKEHSFTKEDSFTKEGNSTKEDKRQLGIKELFDTEQAYVEALMIVEDLLQDMLCESTQDIGELSIIYENWHNMLESSYFFLSALKIRSNTSIGGIFTTIADILCEHLLRMKAPYLAYWSHKMDAVTIIESLTKTDNRIADLMKQFSADPSSKRLPISSFLIQPGQRIARYPLLINTILKYTDKEHSDVQFLEEASRKAVDLCRQVDELIQEKNNFKALKWLQKHIESDMLSELLVFNSTTHDVGPRKCLYNGALKTRNGKELIGFLMNDFLLLALPMTPLEDPFSFDLTIPLRIYKEPLLLTDLSIYDSVTDTRKVEFQLEYNKIVFNLSANSEAGKNKWLKKIMEAKNVLKERERDNKLRKQVSITKRRPKGMLKLFIVSGRELNLLPIDGVVYELFCEVSVGNKEKTTSTVQYRPGITIAKWQECVRLLIKDLNEDEIEITVKSKATYSPDKFLGSSKLTVPEILNEIQTKGSGPLKKELKLDKVCSGKAALMIDINLFKNV